MNGRKTLGEIRAELEAALSGILATPPAEGEGAALRSGRREVVDSLRRFLDRVAAPPEPSIGPPKGAGQPAIGPILGEERRRSGE